MRIGIDNALDLPAQALSLRSQRTQMLGANIANADTPGYKATDINFQAVLADRIGQASSAPSSRLTATHAQHIDSRHPEASREVQYRVPLMPALDGNTVDTQLEQAEFAENSIQFLTNLRVLNGRIKGMLTAIKGE